MGAKAALTSEDMLRMVYDFLQEEGFPGAAFLFGHQSNARSHPRAGLLPAGALKAVVQDGLRYRELRARSGAAARGDATGAAAAATGALAARAAPSAAVLLRCGDPSALEAEAYTPPPVGVLLAAHSRDVLALAWRPAAPGAAAPPLLASASADGTARLWRPQPRAGSPGTPAAPGAAPPAAVLQHRHVIGRPACAVAAVAFAPHGGVLATAAAHDGGSVLLWHAASGALIAQLLAGADTPPVSALAWSTNGAYLAASCDRSGAYVFPVAQHLNSPAAVARAPERAGGGRDAVRAAREAAAPKHIEHTEGALDVVWPDAQHVIFALSSGKVAIHRVRAAASGNSADGAGTDVSLARKLEAHGGAEVNCVAAAPGGKCFATGGDDGGVAVWKATAREMSPIMRLSNAAAGGMGVAGGEGRQTRPRAHAHPVTRCRFSSLAHGALQLATCCDARGAARDGAARDAPLKIWAIRGRDAQFVDGGGALRAALRPEGADVVDDVAWDAKGAYLAAVTLLPRLFVWRTADWSLALDQPLDSVVIAAAWEPNGTRLAVGKADGTAELIDLPV